MNFSPKIGVVISVLAVLISVVAVMSPSAFPSYVPAATAAAIISTCAFMNILFNAVNTVLHLYSSSNPGPLAPPDPPSVVAAQKASDRATAVVGPVTRAFIFLAVTAALCASLRPNAWAGEESSPTAFNLHSHLAPPIPTSGVVATPPATPPLGNVGCDPLKLLPGCSTTGTGALPSWLQDALNFFNSDFQDAAELAVSVPGLQDGNGQQCWLKASSINDLLKKHPYPLTLKIATDFEAVRLFNMAINNLCIDPHCTQVFTDLGNQIQAVGVGIPVPNLTGICTKIATIPVVAPISVGLIPGTIPVDSNTTTVPLGK